MNAPPDELIPGEGGDKGPGARLHEARVTAGLSLEQVSARLHLDRRIIDLLEADDFVELPAPTFVRGYLRSYARLLDLPPGPIIEAFDRRGFAPPALIADIATQAETRSTDFWVVTVTIGIAALLVVLAAMWFQTQRGDNLEVAGVMPGLEALPAPEILTVTAQGPGSGESIATSPPGALAAREGPQGGATSAAPPSGTGAASSPSPTTSALPSVAETDRPASSSGAGSDPTDLKPEELISSGMNTRAATALSVRPEATPAGPGSDPANASSTGAGASSGSASAGSGSQGAGGSESPSTKPKPAPAASEEGSDRSLAGAAGAEARTSPNGPVDTVAIRFSREAWVEIYDATDTRLYYNLAQPGRNIKVEGIRPLRVLLGYVKGVQVEYNGKPFDFSPYVTKGIARFELTP